ncbi:MAG: hypothetical protein ACREEB_01620 [Caulobacteraceae bacterium]
MSIVQSPESAVDHSAIKWIGYALAVVGVAAPFGVLFFGPGAVSTMLVLIVALDLAVLFGLVAAMPEAFLIQVRGGSRVLINYALIVPIFALLIVSFNSGLVHPEIGYLIALAAAGAGLMAGLWIPRRAPVPGAVLFLLFLSLFAAGYGWGVASLANRFFDNSAGQPYPVTVIAKHETYGRGRGYSLTIAPWGPASGSASVGVPLSTYNDATEGGTVCAVLHSGALGLAWYRVRSC